MTGLSRMIPGTTRAVMVSAVLLAAATGVASAQSLDQQLAGGWRLAQDNVRGDGLGPDATGMLIFAGGNFSLQIVRGDLAPFHADDRRGATPDESQASGRGSLAYFGSYSASDADHGLTLHIARSSFPNWSGADQKWVVTVAADKLTLTDAQDRSATLVWTRAGTGGAAPLMTRGGRRVVHY